MSNTTPKLEVVPPDDGPMTIAKPDEFNLDKFKSTRAATMANVETLLSGLPHHKISDAKDFVRLHATERAYWSDELCFVNVPTNPNTEATQAANEQTSIRNSNNVQHPEA